MYDGEKRLMTLCGAPKPVAVAHCERSGVTEKNGEDRAGQTRWQMRASATDGPPVSTDIGESDVLRTSRAEYSFGHNLMRRSWNH